MTYNSKNKTQKIYAKNKQNLNLIPKNCVFVFPIEIVGGKTQVSNLGIMPNRVTYDKGSFLYWQEVFDGRSALKIQWQDSITLEKPENQNYYIARPHIGRYYYGKPISPSTEELEISEDASFEDFLSMKTNQTVTLKFQYTPTDREASKRDIEKFFRFQLVDNDMYNLYQIPEICEGKLMYISNHQEYYDDQTGLSAGCEITFSSLGDKIQKSGKAIEQYCAWNAPGEFSVRPKVIEYDDQKYVIIDPIPLFYPTPVKYLQVEQQGPALTSTIYAIGRRQEYITEQYTDPESGETYNIDYWKIGPSKFLLPCEFVTTQPNPLNRSSTPSKNYYCFPDEQVTMVTNTECLKWMLDSATQPLETTKNNGMISMGSNWSESGSHIRTEHPSNPADATTGIRKDYFDRTWYPLSYASAPLGPHDTSGCVYAEDTMSFAANDTMIDIMCKNAFIYNSQPIIPLSYYDSRPLYLRNIPIIGSIANFFKIGDLKLSSRTVSRKNSSLCLFGDCSVMNMCANLNGSTEAGQGTFGTPFKTGACVFPINFFGTNETKFQKLGVNSVNTTFCVALTDLVNIDGTTYDTIYLAQDKKEDGTYVKSDHKSLLVNSTMKPVKPVTSNFIIDMVVVQSVFDGKIRLSCYGEEENDFIYPQWTATILSNANWEGGNMRDWTNIFPLSNWEERFCVQEDEFTWPAEPHKEETDGFIWQTNAVDTFIFNVSQLWTNWQTITGFSWPQTTKIDTRTVKSTLNKTFYEQTIQYSDIGKASVVDKDTFLTYFGSMSFDFNGSFIGIDSKSLTINGQNKRTVEFEAGTYTYTYTTGKLDLCSLRSNGQYEIELGQHQFVMGEDRGGSGEGTAFQSIATIELVLGDNGITLKMYDKSNIVSTITGVPETEVGGKNFTTYAIVNRKPVTEKFNYSINLKEISFSKRA